jgi:hypothetical protein
MVPVVSIVTWQMIGSRRPSGRHPVLAAHDCGLDLQQVLAGLHQVGVGTAAGEALRRLRVRVAHLLERGLTERGQLGARPEGAQDHPRRPVLGRAHLVGDLPGDRRPLLGELTDPVDDVVVAEVGQVAPEGVGLHQVRAGGEVRAVDLAHHVRAGGVEDLVAALEPEEVGVDVEVDRLQHRAHRPVTDQYSPTGGIQHGRIEIDRHGPQCMGGPEGDVRRLY